MIDWTQISENHPVKRLFRNLTDRALTQSSLTDKDILIYLTDLLLKFIDAENLHTAGKPGQRFEYLVDMLEEAKDAPVREKKKHYQHIGDYSLFILGMFPESLSYGRRCIPESYYADTGRRSYLVASELERSTENTVVYRKMAGEFERCVVSLNWVREYTTDPFYQYMLREFRVM